jgi:membrane-associated protease RseP (regulator of RpoE activity)
VFFAEPTRTRFDLHFNVGKIPVRVHPLFWLISMLLGVSGGGGVISMTLWVVAIFVSILVHELGHALMARRYGWPAHVVLWQLGGLAIYTPTHRSRTSRILIAFAGPGAGFVVGGLVLAGVLAAGYSTVLPGLGLEVGSGPMMPGGRAPLFIQYLLAINMFWGLINLAPIQPLDGGTIAQSVIEKYRPRDGLRLSIQLSMVCSIALAVLGMAIWQSMFIAVMFGLFAFQSWQLLQQLRNGGY